MDGNKKCVNCEHNLVWQNDFSYEDFGIEGDGIVTIWDCPYCGAMHEVYIPTDKNEE